MGDHGSQALALGLVDSVGDSLAQTVANADLVVVATPVTAMSAVLDQISAHIASDAIVTDCASTKASTVAAARTYLGSAMSRFVPGHPISGSEFSGPSAARADQFVDKLWLLSPLPETDSAAVARLKQVIAGMGARCDQISADIHDDLFAEYSHAPHALVYAICDAVANGPNAERLSELAGAGFKDTTRIGATSPELWTDILLDNRVNVLAAMDRYASAIAVMRTLLDADDRAGLLALLRRAADWRRGLDDKKLAQH